MESRCICQLWYFTRLQQLCTHCQVFLKLLQRFLCSPLLWKLDLMWFFYIRQSVEKTDTEAWAECFVELLKMQVIIHHKWRQGCAIGHRQWHALCVNLFRRNFWLSHRQAPPFFSLVITISKYFCGWCPIFIKQRESCGFYQTDGCDFRFCVSKLWNGTWVELCCSKASTKDGNFPLYSKPRHHS
jgi:hypothetical protein